MSEIPAGAMRFNSDSQKLEYWNGSAWFQVHTATPDLASAGDPTPGARACFGSGTTPSTSNTIDYINIASTGDAVDFGGCVSNTKGGSGSVASRTRGVWAGGQHPGVNADIHFITIASTGDSIDFNANLSSSRRFAAGVSNETRGCFGGGLNSTDLIDYITIASTGVAAVDFGGDLTEARGQCAGLASPTRGIFAGGHAHPSPSNSVQVIDMITIATTGVDASDFGDLINSGSEDLAGASNATKGLIAGGSPAGNASQNIIQFITINTLGNATNFGDLVVGATSKGGAASPTRAVFAGGYTNPGSTMTDAIDYVQIATEGNAVDFGNLTDARDQLNGVSNAHGGL